MSEGSFLCPPCRDIGQGIYHPVILADFSGDAVQGHGDELQQAAVAHAAYAVNHLLYPYLLLLVHFLLRMMLTPCSSTKSISVSGASMSSESSRWRASITERSLVSRPT